MRKGYLSLMVTTSIMLVIILIHAINKAALEGISVYIAYLAALMIALMSIRIFNKKKKIGTSDRKIAALSLGMLLVSYISATYTPYILGLPVASASTGINIKYLVHALKKTIKENEGD